MSPPQRKARPHSLTARPRAPRFVHLVIVQNAEKRAVQALEYPRGPMVVLRLGLPVFLSMFAAMGCKSVGFCFFWL